MAIPHSKKPSGNKTEARVYDLLMNGLDEQWHLWHEPEIHRKEDEDRPYRPDFILLHENHGMFVLEVKGWVVERIKGIETEKLTKKIKGYRRITKVIYDFHQDGEKPVEIPFDQLAKYKRAITRKLQQRSSSFGLAKKKVANLFDGAIAFVNIDSDNLENRLAEEHSEIIESVLQHKEHRAFYKRQIDMWQGRPDQVEKELSKKNENLALSQEQLNIIRGIFHPESCLPVAPSSIISVEQLRIDKEDSSDYRELSIEESLSEPRVLSQIQEDIARYEIGGGHRTLFGVAGSGKTMILIARARWLAMRNPEFEILVLCFNRALSLYIAKVLQEYRNVLVMTFHAWVREKIGFDLDFNDLEYDNKLLDHLSKLKADKYHTILIDECQDWRPDWFKAILFAAEDPVNGDLLVAGDGSQSIYREHTNFSWEDCGINPQPWHGHNNKKAIALDRNYRNTPQIIALASSFARRLNSFGGGSHNGMLSHLPDPNECHRSDGPKPRFGQFSERRQEMEFIAEEVNGLIKTIDCLNPCEFAIVYPGRLGIDNANREFATLFEKFDKMSIPYNLIQGGVERNQEQLLEGNTVKVLNVKQMKGLEQKICFVVGVDKYKDGDEHLLYVSMTRATDWLYLTWSGENRSSIIGHLTADSSLYFGQFSTSVSLNNSQDHPAEKSKRHTWSINDVLGLLDAMKNRATYSAVATVLGIEPKEVGGLLGGRRPETSWIVRNDTKLPTGYSEKQRHPDLYQSEKILNDGNELESLLIEWRAQQEKEQEK